MFFPDVSPLSLLLLLSTFQSVLGQDLRPIRNTKVGLVDEFLTKRSESPLLDLQDAEEFLWGADDDDEENAMGKLKVYMPEEYENILNAEKFSPLIKSLECDEGGVTMTFNDDDTFEHARAIWDWANGADDRHFVLVIGAGDCGWNEDRQPYVVRNLEFDEAEHKTRLIGEPKDWEEFAHSFDLVVGHVPDPARRRRRDINHSASIGFNQRFPFALELKTGQVGTKLECLDCGTSGQFKLELVVTQRFFVPTGVKMRLSPSAVKATAKLKWSLYGQLTEKLEKTSPKIALPAPGSIRIPKVVELGPAIELYGGMAFAELKAMATMTGGATASIPDTAIVELNLLNPSENKFSGWTPQIEQLPFEVDARLQAQIETYLALALAIRAAVLGKGYSVGLELKAPYLNGKLEYILSATGACSTNKREAVRASINIGTSLSLKAAEASSNKALFEVKIGTIDFPLAQKCWPFGETIEGSPFSSVTATSPALPGPTSTSPPTGTSCKIKSGASGSCISTSACSAAGGTSEAGHCPGGNDVQCCVTSTPPPPTSESCKHKDGASGTCISTSQCAQNGGVPEAGHCPGSSDIQCCAQKPATPEPTPTGTTCKHKSGASGTCISTSQCAQNGGVSEAGHCPGSSDIQCCAEKPSTPEPTATTCKHNSGVAGTCKSTSQCKQEGGKSEAGHCPGSADVQCCAQVDEDPELEPQPTSKPEPQPTADSCKHNDGSPGTCMSTTQCDSEGGKPEAGHCPGPSNIQCCAKSTSPPPGDSSPPKTCKVNSGESGTCISTEACSSQGGISEPGHCPGAANIQCCYEAEGGYGDDEDDEEEEEESPNECIAHSGEKGSCISTSLCKSEGMTSQAGLCPGAADIQCCFEPKTVTCGGVSYSSSQRAAAKKEGCDHYKAGTTVGASSYPHEFGNREGIALQGNPPWYEFPILSSGVYTDGRPGADRVTFDASCRYTGLITHTGASTPGGFVGCSDSI